MKHILKIETNNFFEKNLLEAEIKPYNYFLFKIM